MTIARPQPRIDRLNAPFWETAKAGKLSVQACTGCGDLHFPPSPVCPACLSDAQEWRVVSGAATLESWVDFHRAYWDGFRDALPYRVCLVRLAEGPLLVSNLVGPSADARLGAALQARFEDLADGLRLPVFALAGA